ncbi:MAG: Efflux transporter, family, subunit [Verrucomicrobiales bacterium]|nr:Efflux transporter, family, subunit [Verrucomicrobiales bacterium]
MIVVAALGAGGFFGWKKLKTQTPTRTNVRATTAQVMLRDIHLVLDAAGDISPADQVSVRPEVNGRIAQLPVDIGDQVKKGDMLFTLDDSDLQIERKSKLSDIASAKLQLQKAERNYGRSQKLFDDKLISREAYDDVKTEFDVAKNTLQRLEQDLNLVDDHISKTRILAPFDCTVLTRPVSTGQAVSGSGGFNSGTEVMTIANLTDMIILAHVNQADVAHLKIGQPVDVRVEAVADIKMKGKIDRIAPQATIRNNLKGFDVRISIRNIDQRVRPGMTANLSIPVVSTKDTVAVPINAVFSEPNNDTKEVDRFVYVKKDQEVYERRPVSLGVSDNDYAEIVDGVATNEVVSLEEPPDGAEIKSATGKPLKKKRGGKGGRVVGGGGGGSSTNRISAAALVPK